MQFFNTSIPNDLIVTGLLLTSVLLFIKCFFLFHSWLFRSQTPESSFNMEQRLVRCCGDVAGFPQTSPEASVVADHRCLLRRAVAGGAQPRAVQHAVNVEHLWPPADPRQPRPRDYVQVSFGASTWHCYIWQTPCFSFLFFKNDLLPAKSTVWSHWVCMWFCDALYSSSYMFAAPHAASTVM